MTYAGYSRFTDPGGSVTVLEDLPDDVEGLCAVAEQQTIHHNLLGYYGISPASAQQMRRVWPPRVADVLAALEEMEPRVLDERRLPKNRVVGACMLESHFLAGLFRSKGIPTRIRAGYFRDIRTDPQHVVGFWRGALSARAIDHDLQEEDPDRWQANVDAITTAKNDVDHHIEHWVVEHSDGTRWRVADANRTFLKAHSNIDVGYELPSAYFELAHEAWSCMRTSPSFDSERYVEDPQDGRSHIRSQLLWDFYSLLNHDIAGIDELAGATFAFVKRRHYEETTAEELSALDALAAFLASDPDADALVRFYFDHEPLRISCAEADPYSFVSSG